MNKHEFLQSFLQNTYEIESTLKVYHFIDDLTKAPVHDALLATLNDLKKINKVVTDTPWEVDIGDGETELESVDDRIKKLSSLKFQVRGKNTCATYYMDEGEGKILKSRQKKNTVRKHLYQTLFRQHLADEDKNNFHKGIWNDLIYTLESTWQRLK